MHSTISISANHSIAIHSVSLLFFRFDAVYSSCSGVASLSMPGKLAGLDRDLFSICNCMLSSKLMPSTLPAESDDFGSLLELGTTDFDDDGESWSIASQSKQECSNSRSGPAVERDISGGAPGAGEREKGVFYDFDPVFNAASGSGAEPEGGNAFKGTLHPQHTMPPRQGVDPSMSPAMRWRNAMSPAGSFKARVSLEAISDNARDETVSNSEAGEGGSEGGDGGGTETRLIKSNQIEDSLRLGTDNGEGDEDLSGVDLKVGGVGEMRAKSDGEEGGGQVNVEGGGRASDLGESGGRGEQDVTGSLGVSASSRSIHEDDYINVGHGQGGDAAVEQWPDVSATPAFDIRLFSSTYQSRNFAHALRRLAAMTARRAMKVFSQFSFCGDFLDCNHHSSSWESSDVACRWKPSESAAPSKS